MQPIHHLLSRACAILVLVLPALVHAAPAAAQAPASGDGGALLVLRSTMEHLAAGQMIGGGVRITLPAGRQLALLDAAGRLRIVTGPFDGRATDLPVRAEAATATDGKLALLAALLADRGAEGALRGDLRSGAPKAAKRPGPWAVSVDQGGAACGQPDRVTFWRTEFADDARIAIELGARKANAVWKKGQATLAMPAALFVSGRTYKAQIEGRSPVDITLHLAASDMVSPVDQAVWMASVGCKQQALSVLDALE